MTHTNFAELGLSRPLLRALQSARYSHPTPIQQRAIPLLLEGADLLGIAQTGTGKTAAFTLPLLQNLREDNLTAAPRTARSLILAPTRELAVQIAESLSVYGRHMPLRHAVVMGGVNARSQIAALKRGVDVLVATPGRLLDLVKQRHVDLRACHYLVIDEADRMFDMGFIRDVRSIVTRMPDDRQTLLFSATMPTEVARLAGEVLCEPERIEVASKSVAVERIEQQVHHLDAAQKRDRLTALLKSPELGKVIVFTRTKHRADRVARHLSANGVTAEALHGNKTQGARQRTLERFRSGRSQVLVATDIASRGLDVDDITHVVNYELPNEPESYVHRIGRTARAGASGTAISFCDAGERPYLAAIERLIRRPLTIVGEVPEAEERPARGKSGNAARPSGQRPARSRRRPRRSRPRAA